MATAGVHRRARDRPLGTTLLLTALGYALVVGTFAGLIPLYPDIGERGVNLLSHSIAVVNTLATIALVLGWYWIRRGEVDRHRIAMMSAFALIVLFLLLYLPKVGGGGEKHFVLESAYAWVPLWSWIHPAYLVMLAIHIVLSVLAVPLVLYALVLGLTHGPTELAETRHATVGRIAAATWILSLTLGVVTYVLLNHLYAAEFVPA
ncbi:DUF420 domain-containing protein [Halalkalicoccus salilacus]|uniref:DUF420 domain-containing protein n=1 Tax=Halalkalicoccus salilacus TaxID=3117459 RepID=UPI00300F2C3D